MKKNVFVRILAALGGLTLWMLGLSVLAETLFGVQITSRVGLLLGAHTPVAVLAALVLTILLCTFGVSCWMMLSNKRTAKSTGFVMQKGENGAIGVSVRSIEGLVQTCVRQHEMISSAEISVTECRDGILLLLNIEVAEGVNIPLAVGALQKQVKQYVSECTGLDVREVRVLVENAENGPVTSPYAVQEPAAVAAVMETTVHPAEQFPEEDMAVELPFAEVDQREMLPEEVPQAEEMAEQLMMEEVASVPQNVSAAVPVITEVPEEDDDRPLHQRLFSTEETLVFVPVPPELVVEPAAEAVAEQTEMAESEPAEEAEAADLDGNAVMEVVAAMAEESAGTDDEQIPAEQEEIREE